MQKRLSLVENNCVGIPSVVELNVGGSVYTTSLTTLLKYPDSSLNSMFNGRQRVIRDGHGRFFIDRDGTLFRYVLDYLRNSTVTLPSEFKERDRLIEEARYYKLDGLIEILGDNTASKSTNDDGSSSSSESQKGYLSLCVRGTYAFGRDGLADIKFRKLQRIMVSGNVALVRDAFGDQLNETRDPDRDEGCYTTRFYLKHNQLERAFDSLANIGFSLITSSGGGAGYDPESDETKWNHFANYVFYR